MEFNFDSEENRQQRPPPSRFLTMKLNLWISDQCAETRGWKVDGIPHDIKTEKYHLRKYHLQSTNANTSTLSSVKSGN
jgi:hypothetical protein